MASNRMTQAIATLERAVSRLEQEADDLVSSAPAASSQLADPMAARAALKSLDDLITELKGPAHG